MSCLTLDRLERLVHFLLVVVAVSIVVFVVGCTGNQIEPQVNAKSSFNDAGINGFVELQTPDGVKRFELNTGEIKPSSSEEWTVKAWGVSGYVKATVMGNAEYLGIKSDNKPGTNCLYGDVETEVNPYGTAQVTGGVAIRGDCPNTDVEFTFKPAQPKKKQSIEPVAGLEY